MTVSASVVKAKASKKSDARGGIQVIARAANILRALEGEGEGLSLGEIAARVDLPRSTVQRIVTALADEQLLIAAAPKSRVKLGPALIRLAKATNNEFEKIAHPFMLELSRDMAETVDLAVMQGKTAVFVDQVTGIRRLRAVSAIGERFPLHCTAVGKALLATLPDNKLDRRLAKELKSLTIKTITDPLILRREIDAIRNGDLAVDVEEHTDGVCALSLAFIDPLERAFAIGMPVPTTRFIVHRERYAQALRVCRNQIVDALGEYSAQRA